MKAAWAKSRLLYNEKATGAVTQIPLSPNPGDGGHDRPRPVEPAEAGG